VRRVRPDVLHAHWALPNGLIGAVVSAVTGVPLVVSIPGSDARVAASHAVFRRLARFVFRRASLITANSGELRDAALALGADPAKFDMIVYGTEPDKFKPDSTGVSELRASLGIRPDAVIALAVGRMVPKKGFDVLLRALAEPALAGRPIVAVLVGVGDQWKAWQQLGRDLGIADRTRWVGSVSSNRIGVYYNAADMLVMPAVSRPADGLNVCVLDAMSCGKPVVGSDVAGNPLAIVDHVTGRIVPEGSSSALAAAMAELVDAPGTRERMGAAGRKRVDEALGWPVVARRFLQYFSALSAPGGSGSRQRTS
jgi:glycosyltransferase involved in cell wall biosynthesis